MKHEAFAVAKASGRAVPTEEPCAREPDEHAWTDDRAERYERLRLGAEAMSALKPQEIRCLLLRAEGLSYQEICAATGFSYTKVNRCLTEGRRAFLERVAGIESGAECKRLAPLISKVADGEATPEEMRSVRPHLKSCLACKATLREYRATPTRIAGLVPPVVALAGGGSSSGFLGRMLAALNDRFAGMGDAAGAKAAAVAASMAVLAGGGAAGVGALDHDAPIVPRSAYADTAADPQPAAATTPASTSAIGAPDPSPAAAQAVAAPTAADPQPAVVKPEQPPAPEFDPGAGNEPNGGSEADPQPGEFASTPAAPPTPRAGFGPSTAGEFGP